MRSSLLNLITLFDERSFRERLLIAVVIVAATFALWDGTVGGWVVNHKTEVITDVERLARDLQMQNNEQQRLLQQDTAPARRALVQQKTRLQALLVERQAELDALLAKFVAPEDVPDLLEDVLHDYQGLKLVRLASKAAEPLMVQTAESAAANPTQSDLLTIYRHPVELQFEGGYLDVVAYLTTLENGPWGLSWRKLEYAVGDYPKATVLIELETLSREKEWLGV
jgi:MSHA biogenesis protein MshJ